MKSCHYDHIFFYNLYFRSSRHVRQRPWVQIPLKSRNFFRVNLQLLKLQLPLRRSHLHLKFVFLQFTSSFYAELLRWILYRWCYTGRLERTIFSETQGSIIVATLFQMATTLFQPCNTLLRKKLSL